jgi:hypothetical protein
MTMKTLTFAALAALTPALAMAQDAADTPAENSSAEEAVALKMNIDEEGYVPFKCPIEQIRSAYQNLVNPEDTLVALAIEKQTLAICRQSQEALIRIAENETRLTELFEPIIAPPPPPAPEPEPEPVIVVEVEPEIVEPEPIEPPEPVEPPKPEFVQPSYTLAAVMKDPQGWKAMIVDGAAIHTLRVGDKMDDGSRVVSIARGKVEFMSKDNHSFVLE